jgi:hypothetical protein
MEEHSTHFARLLAVAGFPRRYSHREVVWDAGGWNVVPGGVFGAYDAEDLSPADREQNPPVLYVLMRQRGENGQPAGQFYFY